MRSRIGVASGVLTVSSPEVRALRATGILHRDGAFAGQRMQFPRPRRCTAVAQRADFAGHEATVR
jgi:hypothetical protein